MCHMCIYVTKYITVPFTPASYADVSFKASAPKWGAFTFGYETRMEYFKRLSKVSHAIKAAFCKRFPFMNEAGSRRILEEQNARPLMEIERQTFELDTPQRTPARRQANEYGGFKKGFLS